MRVVSGGRGIGRTREARERVAELDRILDTCAIAAEHAEFAAHVVPPAERLREHLVRMGDLDGATLAATLLGALRHEHERAERTVRAAKDWAGDIA